MKEITGDLWSYFARPHYKICLTINGTIKANGAAVMGRGCALEATQKMPNIAKVWGGRLKDYGLKLMYLHEYDLFMFPVKYNWWERADIDLIEHSAMELARAAEVEECVIVLPRPGCGNGHLNWPDVKRVIAPKLPDNVWVISKG